MKTNEEILNEISEYLLIKCEHLLERERILLNFIFELNKHWLFKYFLKKRIINTLKLLIKNQNEE